MNKIERTKIKSVACVCSISCTCVVLLFVVVKNFICRNFTDLYTPTI
jgi:hypothetical protein